MLRQSGNAAPQISNLKFQISNSPLPAPQTMSAETPISVTEFHRELATELFNHVLSLLERTDRTCAEDDRMIHAAHASRFHWEFGGGPLNMALGEWQCARVHTAMRHPEAALHHAWRYLEHAESYGLGAFHLAYAHAAIAGAFALKDPAQCLRHLEQARELAPHLTDEEEIKLLERELEIAAAALPKEEAPSIPAPSA